MAWPAHQKASAAYTDTKAGLGRPFGSQRVSTRLVRQAQCVGWQGTGVLAMLLRPMSRDAALCLRTHLLSSARRHVC